MLKLKIYVFRSIKQNTYINMYIPTAILGNSDQNPYWHVLLINSTFYVKIALNSCPEYVPRSE